MKSDDSALGIGMPGEGKNLIKLDLHIHTLDDPKDKLDYSAHELLARARRLGFSALAITLHDEVFDRPKVFADADRRTRHACPQPGRKKFEKNNDQDEGNDGEDGEADEDEWFHGRQLNEGYSRGKAQSVLQNDVIC